MAAKKTAKVSAKSKAGPSPKVAKRAAQPKAAAPAAKAKTAVAPKAAKPAPKAPKAEPTSGIGEGSTAPAFSLLDDAGQTVASGSLKGKPYVLYFYPKDDTPGCTREACDFRDNLSAFNSRKVRVLGVSPDAPAAHTKFKKKYSLTFTLLSDPEKELAKAYGVWAKKLNYGKEYMGIVRSTFVVNAAGKIVKAWRGVRVDGHVVAVLEAAANA